MAACRGAARPGRKKRRQVSPPLVVQTASEPVAEFSSERSTRSGSPVAAVVAAVSRPQDPGAALRPCRTKQFNDEELLDRMKAATTSLKRRKLEQKAQRTYWTQTHGFNAAIGAVVMANAVSMGLEADHGRAHPEEFLAAEHVFTAVFLAELLLHFAVEGYRVYFQDKSNWLDFVLVLMSIADVWVIQQLGVQADLRMMSLLRLLRLSRLARLVRLFRIFKELTQIVEGFLGGIRALTWALLFLSLLLYIFAIFARLRIGGRFICSDGRTEAQEGEVCPEAAGGGAPGSYYAFNEEIGDQGSLFGSVSKTMLTLFVCLTEGCGIEVIHPTVLQTPLLGGFWMVFVLVTMLGVLNLIIGLFCENSIKVALETEKEIMKHQDNKRRAQLEALQRAFMRMDPNGNGEITRPVFDKAIVENEEVVAAMTALGLDEEQDLFDVLDADHSGSLEFKEFFDGIMLIMKGQEPALAKDMVGTYLRVSAVFKGLARLQAEMESIRKEEREGRDKLLEAVARLEQRLERSVRTDVWKRGPSPPAISPPSLLRANAFVME